MKLMKNFNKKLKDNLEDFLKENKEKDEFTEDLKDRLRENEEQLKKDEKLLEELQKVQDKINKEELAQKLEELGETEQKQKTKSRTIVRINETFLC